MSELPKNNAEPVSDADESDDYGSTSIDRTLLARLKEAEEKKKAEADAKNEDADPTEGEAGGTAVVRYPSPEASPQTPEGTVRETPAERTSPGVLLSTLESGPVSPERSEPQVASNPTPVSPPPEPEPLGPEPETRQETVQEPSGKGIDEVEEKPLEVKQDPSELDDWGAGGKDEPAQESGLHTDVRKDVVGLDEARDNPPPPPPPTRSVPTRREGSGGDLKATIDLPDRGELDDGWGGSTGTGQNTKSAMRRLEEPETGAMEKMQAEQAAALISKNRETQPPVPEEDPEAPRLICIQGPDLGKEFVLNGRDIAIGRAPGNDVIINDPSVSRVHCRLLIDQGRYVATDQRSGNGTVVNGRKIERADLTSGSTIKLGQTILRFVEMGDVIKSTETESHKAEEEQRSRIVKSAALSDDAPPSEAVVRRPDASTRYALIIVAVAVVVGLGIVVWSLATRGSGGLSLSPQELAEEAYESARTAVKAKELDKAQEKLHLAITARPDEARFKELLTTVEKERGNLTALDEAKSRAKDGRFAEALVALASVTKDTQYKADVSAAREEVRELVLAAVREALDAKDAQAMAALARDVGDAFGDEADVKRMLERLAKQKPSEKAPPEQKHVEKVPEQKPAEQKPAERVKSNGTGSIGKAMDAFNAGKLDDAIEILGQTNGDEATALKNKITKFVEVYKDAKAAGASEAAVKKALAFESKIAQGRSAFATELRKLQAEALIVSGSKALDQKPPKYMEAYKAFRAALALSPDASVAKRRITEIQAAARDLYNQGYIHKDSDRIEARAKWERVLLMVPPEDELHQKAKKWLDSTK